MLGCVIIFLYGPSYSYGFIFLPWLQTDNFVLQVWFYFPIMVPMRQIMFVHWNILFSYFVIVMNVSFPLWFNHQFRLYFSLSYISYTATSV